MLNAVTSVVTGGGGRVAIVIDRPRGNVLTSEVIAELRHAVAGARCLHGVRLLTIEGAGADFSFGVSVGEHTPALVGPALKSLHELLRDLLDLPIPTMALVRGRCLGGGFELALACDLVFAEAGATLGLPEVSLGVFPPAAAALLPARIGTSRATAAILAGVARPADWWQRAGLIERVAERDALAGEVDAWYATACAPRSAAALGHAALAARATLRQAALPALDEVERQYLERLMTTEDAVEGIAAFLDKRVPVWRHA